jgi:signal transduction histidine kinase
MSTIESLDIIYPNWLSRVSRDLAKGEELREDFKKSLIELFFHIKQAVQTGDPSWLDPILEKWVDARTSTELEIKESSLAPIIGLVFLHSQQLASDLLSPFEAIELTGALIPIFSYCFEYTAKREMELNIDHISHELELANANLKHLDKSKSDFISIAAHELKTPLTLIDGYSSMLKEQLESDNHPANTKVLLKGIDNGTARLQEIVDDMIDVSLIDNNLLSLNFQPLWINRLINVLKDEFSKTIKERHLTLVIKEFHGYDELTFGDNERLYQALRNVISNAIKYTPDGGEIKINGRKLPGFIEIIISDTGIGIDLEDHTKIFEKFGRLGKASLHSSGKTKFKGGGPGLGLPITKGIIEAHGGTIWVESSGYDENSCPGSTFHILLPERNVPPDDKTAKLFYPLSQLDQEKTSNE